MIGTPIQDVRRRQAVTNNLFAKIFRNHHITVSDSKVAFQRLCEAAHGRAGRATFVNRLQSDAVPEAPYQIDFTSVLEIVGTHSRRVLKTCGAKKAPR